MTSIAKTDDELRAEARKINPDDPQGDFFVTPEEIKAAKAALATKNPTPAEDARSPEEKRRAAWRERWEAGKEQRAQPIAAPTAELLALRSEHEELIKKHRDVRRQLAETSEMLARVKEDLARATQSKDQIVIAGKHEGAPLDIEVTPKMLVALEIDSDCGCIKHARPSDFQFAITQAGSVYVRTTDRGLGKFFRAARSGPTHVRVISARVIVPDEPAVVCDRTEGT